MANVHLGRAKCGEQEDADFRLKACQGRLKVCYCSKERQKQRWPTHRAFCKELQARMKSIQSNSIVRQPCADAAWDTFSIENAKRSKEPLLYSFASGYGNTKICLQNNPKPGNPHFVKGSADNTHFGLAPQGFLSLESGRRELLSFLVSCALGKLEAAQLKAKQLILPEHRNPQGSWLDGGAILNDVRFPGSYLNGLDIAARKGHEEVVEWLISDPLTRPQFESPEVNEGEFPNVAIAWALYANNVETAKALVQHGCDPTRTAHYIYDHTPAFSAT